MIQEIKDQRVIWEEVKMVQEFGVKSKEVNDYVQYHPFLQSTTNMADNVQDKIEHDKKMIFNNKSIEALDFFESQMYIDKSLIIRDIVKSISKCLLITRPEGWGKCMNFELLRLFLEQQLNEKGEKDQIIQYRVDSIFKRLKITNENVKSIYRKYPVIYLNFQDIKGSSYETIHTGILQQIRKCFFRHSYLLYALEKCQEKYQEELSQLITGFKKIAYNKNTTSGELQQSISLLVNMLYLYHSKKKVFVIINNYDFPINYLIQLNQNNELNQEIIKVNDFISKIVVNSIKNNEYVSKIIINGIFDTLSKSTYPCLSDFHIDNILHGDLYHHFGFTISDVEVSLSKVLLSNHLIQHYKQKITSFYGTYQVSNKELYQPNKIMKFLQEIHKNSNLIILEPHHHEKRNIYSNMIYKLFDCKINAYFHSKLIKLDEGDQRQLKYDPDISLIDFIKHPSNLEAYMVYTLIHTGVITHIIQPQGEVTRKYYFKISNKPILTNILKNSRKKVRIEDEKELYPVKKQENGDDEEYTDDEQHEISESIDSKDKRVTIELDNILGNCLINMAIQINSGKSDRKNPQVTIRITNVDKNTNQSMQLTRSDNKSKGKIPKINIY